MLSGETETGSILIACTVRCANPETTARFFIEIETADRCRTFLLKTEIARIDPVGEEARRLSRDGDDWSRVDARDPRLVLGVGGDATLDGVHAAWLELAKAYHPDRLAALDLPDEILRHAAYWRGIDGAYRRLKDGGAP
jgi:hypothetical protein